MSSYVKAYWIAVDAFQDKTDKAGVPYIEHCRTVEKYYGPKRNEQLSIIAILHDIVEDTNWTLERLREAGFSEYVVWGVDALTRRDQESYHEYIDRLIESPYVIPIKLADLRHNMDLTRLSSLTERDIDRVKRYHAVYQRLNKFV